MSALTEFLHKLVDRAGISELHTEIDQLDKPDEKPVETPAETPAETPVEGEEATPNA